MITATNKNADEKVQQKDEEQTINSDIPTVDPQIQNSIDILNDIIIIQNESLDQGLFYLPEFLDEKINTIKYEPMRIICQSFIDFRKKLNKSIENQLNNQSKNKKRTKKDENHLFHFHTNNTQNSFYNSSIDINSNQDDESSGQSSDKMENSIEAQNANQSIDNSNNNNSNDDNNNNDDEKNDKTENNNSNDNGNENVQSSASSTQIDENYEVQPRQRSSSDYKKHIPSLNSENPNSVKIPPLSVPPIKSQNDDDLKIKNQSSTPSQFFKFPSFTKGKSPFHFRNRERALSTVASSDIPLFKSQPPSPSAKINITPNQFVNDEEKVKKISDSYLNPIPNFASICSTIETIDKILSEFNKTKFDQFANTETRLKNISNNIQSFIRMSNKTKQNLKQIISECQVDSNSEIDSKNDNEFAHIKKSIHSLLLIKEEQSKKIRLQTKEISYLRTQIESLKVFIKNNLKQISKFKQQFFGNYSTEPSSSNSNSNSTNNKNDEIIFHLKQRSKSIDFFNSFLLDDENENQINDFCNKLRIAHEYAQLNSKIKQMDQLLCTIDNEIYIENTDVQFRLEKMRERISKLYRVDEDQITKNWTFICAEGAEIENPEIRSYFFEKQFSETQAKLLSLEKQRTKLFELFFSFSNNKNKKDSNSNNDDVDDDEDDEYISNSISESILDDLNEKNLIIEKKSKIIVDYKKEIDTKNKNIESINKKLKQQMKENEALIKKYEEISNKFGESESQLSSSVKEIKSLNRKIKSFENKNERLQKQLDEIREKNQKNGSITEIKNISNSLVGELSSVKLLADQQEEAINELNQIKEQLEDELEATKEALKDSMSDIQEKSESLKLIEKSLDEEKEKLKSKDLETNEIKSLLEHQIEDNEKLKETIKALTNSSLNEIDIDNDNDVSDVAVISSLKKQIINLKDENEKKEIQIKDLNKQVLASEPRLFSLRRKSLTQKNLINQLTAKTEEIRELIETQYQTEIDQLNKKVDELEFQLQMANKNDLNQNLIENYSENNLNDKVLSLSKENYQLKKMVDELKDQIKQKENSKENLDENAVISIDNEINGSQNQSNDEIVIKCNVDYTTSSENQLINSNENNNYKENNADENQLLIQNEIKELTNEIETLKETNNNLSTQIEDYMKQLKSSQTQLRTIIRLINNEQETERIEPVNDDEFSSTVHKLQQNNEKMSQSSQKSNNSESLIKNNELEIENEKLKEQLNSSQTKLRTIIRLINNEQEIERTEPVNDDEFSSIVHKLQQNKEIILQSSQKSNESNNSNESLTKNNELETENEKLKETNEKLSSQIDDFKEQLNSSQTKLRTIIQLINSDEEAKPELETEQTNMISENEFSQAVKQIQQNKEKISRISQELAGSPNETNNKNDDGIPNNHLNNENDQFTPSISKEQIKSRSIQLEFSQDNDQPNKSSNTKSNDDLAELQKHIDELEQEREKEIHYSKILGDILGENINNISEEQLKTLIEAFHKKQNQSQQLQTNIGINSNNNHQVIHVCDDFIENNNDNESSLQKEKEMIESQYQNEIKELTEESQKLKETNNNLSSQLDDCNEKLKTNQKQLHTIIQAISNKDEKKETINEDEFTQIVHQIQQDKEKISQFSQESNRSNEFKEKENQYQNEIKDLTTENKTLKETNNNLSSQLEDNKKQLKSSQSQLDNCNEKLNESQTRLQTIIQVISNKDEKQETINEDEFTQIVHQIQQDKEKISQFSQESNRSNEFKEKENQYQNEIKELTTENKALKETNNNLSSQLEDNKKQLKLSHSQLRAIIQTINNEQENQNENENENEHTHSITEDEFTQIIRQIQQNKEKLQQITQNESSNNNDLIIALHSKENQTKNRNETKSSNSVSNESETKIYEKELSELREKILSLQKENEILKLTNSQTQSKNDQTDNESTQKVSDSLSFSISGEYDDRYTICIPSLSKDYGYDSNRFSHDMSVQFGPVLAANISTVYEQKEVLTFGFVNFTSRSSDTKLFESENSEVDCYYLKSQVIVTNLPFGIKKEAAARELAKYASSVSINLNENSVKRIFFENSINPEFLIDFKEDVKGAKDFIESFQNMDLNQEISYHMSGYVPLAFYYDPCPYKLNENRQKAIQKYVSNARLIAMMETEQFKNFDFNAYFSGLISKSENDTIYSHQIITDENNDSDDRYRLIVDRRFIVSDSYPQFKKLEVVFMNDLEAVLAQTYAMNYNCDILQIFHSNFKGNRIAGNDF